MVKGILGTCSTPERCSPWLHTWPQANLRDVIQIRNALNRDGSRERADCNVSTTFFSSWSSPPAGRGRKFRKKICSSRTWRTCKEPLLWLHHREDWKNESWKMQNLNVQTPKRLHEKKANKTMGWPTSRIHIIFPLSSWLAPLVSFVFLCFLIFLVFSKFSHLSLVQTFGPNFGWPLQFVPCFCFSFFCYIPFSGNSRAKLTLAKAFKKLRRKWKIIGNYCVPVCQLETLKLQDLRAITQK